MKLDLYFDDIAPEYRYLNGWEIRQKHLTDDARQALEAAGRGTLWFGPEPRSYNSIYPEQMQDKSVVGPGIVPTYSGRVFDVFNPKPEDICLTDIAFQLSKTPRWNRATKRFYSVAEHSILVAKILKESGYRDDNLIRWALLHDAAEAYIGDMPSPIKKSMPKFKSIEVKIMSAIKVYFELEGDEPRVAKQADMYARAIESLRLLPLVGQWQDFWNKFSQSMDAQHPKWADLRHQGKFNLLDDAPMDVVAHYFYRDVDEVWVGK